MRSSNIVRFVVNIALVILIASTLAACSDGGGNPNQPIVPVSFDITAVVTSCPNGSAGNIYCSRTSFPIMINGSWDGGANIATSPMSSTTFQAVSKAVPGRYTIAVVDAGLCDPLVNGCKIPTTGKGITVKGVRLNDGVDSTSFELMKDGSIRP